MKIKQDKTTEQAILEAAEREFLTHGYEQAKTTEIARQAGVTHAMLHYYFRTKENLFSQVFLEKLQLVAESFTKIVESDLPFAEKVKRGIEAHFDFIAQNPQLPRFIMNEVIGNPERIEMCRKVVLPRFQHVLLCLKHAIDEEVKGGRLQPIDPLDLMLNIVSLNLFVFLSRPLIESLTGLESEEYACFMEERKQKNITLVLKGLGI